MDGTGKLCTALYGKVDPRKFIGGIEAQMLHDAADEITRLRWALAETRGQAVAWLRSLSDDCGHQPSELADQMEKDWPTEPFRSTSVTCKPSSPEGETE